MISFWHETLGPPPPRPPLIDRLSADVCIVGAGYTGLWTAHSLLGAEPSLRVVVLEAEQVGFGASGRNGGWLSGLMPGDRELLARAPSGRDGVIALQRALIDAVEAVISVCREEAIEADIVKGGTLAVARTAAQLTALARELDHERSWGLGEADLRLLPAAELEERIRVSGPRGALFSPHCARIQPARLVRGLAEAVERRGGVIHERSRAVAVGAGRVATLTGEVSAPWVVRATEGYTAALPGLRRRLLPMNSSVVITEPLADGVWERIGWRGCETVRDGAHAYAYLQRTADGRIAIGGRGIPYRFGSRLEHAGETPAWTVRQLVATLRDMFPAAAPVPVASTWSGVLGVARDWCPTVQVERHGEGGLAWAGGYVGDGVTTAHLAGRTLADLVLGRDSELTRLPWVGHTARAWEPEPLRWLGARTVYGLYRLADRREARRPDRAAPSRLAAVADRLSGKP